MRQVAQGDLQVAAEVALLSAGRVADLGHGHAGEAATQDRSQAGLGEDREAGTEAQQRGEQGEELDLVADPLFAPDQQSLAGDGLARPFGDGEAPQERCGIGRVEPAAMRLPPLGEPLLHQQGEGGVQVRQRVPVPDERRPAAVPHRTGRVAIAPEFDPDIVPGVRALRTQAGPLSQPPKDARPGRVLGGEQRQTVVWLHRERVQRQRPERPALRLQQPGDLAACRYIHRIAQQASFERQEGGRGAVALQQGAGEIAVGGRMIGRSGERLSETLLRRRQSSPDEEQQPAVVQDVRRVGRDRQRPPVAVLRRRVFAQIPQRVALVEGAGRRGGKQQLYAAERPGGRTGLSLGRQVVAELDPGVHIQRPQCQPSAQGGAAPVTGRQAGETGQPIGPFGGQQNGPAVAGERGLGPGNVASHPAEIGPGGGIPRAGADRLADQPEGICRPPLLEQHRAEQVQRIGMVGIALGNLGVEAGRAGPEPGLLLADAFSQESEGVRAHGSGAAPGRRSRRPEANRRCAFVDEELSYHTI